MIKIIRFGSKFRKINKDKMVDLLWKDYSKKEFISKYSLILDHIIPFVISEDNSINNLQLLNYRENKEKTLIDFKIFKEFRKKGWTESDNRYSLQLNKSMNELREEYLKRFKEEKIKQKSP